MARTTAAGMAKGADAMADAREHLSGGGEGGGGEGTLAEALVDLAKAADFESASLVDDLTRVLVELFKHRPKPFDAMTAGEQNDVVTSLKEASMAFVDKALKLFAADDRPHVTAKAMKLDADGSKTKLILEIKGETAADIASIYAVLRRDVVVILADRDDHMSRSAGLADLVQPDEPGLSFDAEQPAERSKPEGDEEDEETEQVAATDRPAEPGVTDE